jgi:hypothetical protein
MLVLLALWSGMCLYVQEQLKPYAFQDSNPYLDTATCSDAFAAGMERFHEVVKLTVSINLKFPLYNVSCAD